MEELAAKHVLLDIEIITLIALAIGVALYAVIRRQRQMCIRDRSTPHWDVYDLGLMFFPAIMFLMGPFLLVSAAGTEQESAPGDATPGYGALLFNLGIYVFVLMMVHAIVEWIRLRSMKEVFGLTKVVCLKSSFTPLSAVSFPSLSASGSLERSLSTGLAGCSTGSRNRLRFAAFRKPSPASLFPLPFLLQ